MARSREEVEALKQGWLEDPCFDLEDAEGFGDHRRELVAFREHRERLWDAARKEQLMKRAEALGCPGNERLARWAEGVEGRLEKLERRLADVEGRASDLE